MITLVGVQLSGHGKIHQCESPDPHPTLSMREPCIVEKDSGELAFGHMASNYMRLPRAKVRGEPWKVLRKATELDLKMQNRNERLEQEAIYFCKQRVAVHKLPMKLSQVAFAFDGKKATFYYRSDERVDFRQLVRELAKRFRIRVEMRQMGARDMASFMGGCDSCDQELCCARFMNELPPVPIRLARDQNLTGNPDKCTGVCGRLKCCLLFEHPNYAAVMGDMPHPGRTVELPEGKGRVAKVDVFLEQVLVNMEDGRQVAVGKAGGSGR